MGLLLSFLGGAAKRLSESFEKDRDAMLEDIKESASFYRQAGMKRLEERREKEKTLRQRFETVKSLFNDADYGDDIAAAAIRLSDDEFTTFRNTLQQNINQLKEGETLGFAELQKIGVLGKGFTPKEFSVDQAVNNVLGTFEGTTVGNNKNTVSTAAQGLRKHFGTLTPEERETQAMTKASKQLGISVPETQALFSGKGYTYGEGPTGVAFGITDPAARLQARTTEMNYDTAQLTFAQAQAEAKDYDPNFATDRIDPITNKPIGKMTNREYSNYLETLKAEEELKTLANPGLTVSYIKDLNKAVNNTVLKAAFGSTTTDLGTVNFESIDKYNQALQLGFAGVVSSIASEQAGRLRTAAEQTAFFSSMSSPTSVNAIIKTAFEKEERDRTKKEQELVDFVNQAPNLQQKLKELGALPTSERTTTTKTDSEEPPASTNETDSAEPPASTNETDSAEPPDLTKVLPTKDITDANIDGRLNVLSQRVDFSNLTSLSNWLVGVKGQSDMRTYFSLSNSSIDRSVVQRVHDKIKANNITDPREVVEIFVEEANK
jgi:hypothetical protein